jgi:hypothetical protein
MLTPERPMLTPERSSERTENELPLSEVIAANVWCVKLLPPKSALGNYSRLKVPWEITLPPEYIYLV